MKLTLSKQRFFFPLVVSLCLTSFPRQLFNGHLQHQQDEGQTQQQQDEGEEGHDDERVFLVVFFNKTI
jgi:hypothetical protein